MKHVLIVDDYEPNLRLYAAVVKRVIGEEPLAYEDPTEALQSLKVERPSLIIVDYQMPEVDGVGLIRAIREIEGHRTTPIIMLTGINERNLQDRAMAAGATLFLEKPLPVRDFMTKIRSYIAAPASDEELALDGTSSDRDTIVRLHRALRTRHSSLAQHAIRARDLAIAIANELHVDTQEVERLRIAALVYDIGMIGVPDKALTAPWELSARWTSVVREHVNAGATILSGGNSPLMLLAESLARYHHERFDGSGYPEGLRGDAIPLLARIMAVSDAFTAMTSERPYRTEMSGGEALARIKAAAGNAFDPQVVGALERMKDQLSPARRTA
jgi:putative two-component system response regulator